MLSREALRQFVEIGLPDDSKCPFSPKGAEDLVIGVCLERIGVVAGDSRLNDRERMFPFSMAYHLQPPNASADYWYYKMAYYPIHDVREFGFFTLS